MEQGVVIISEKTSAKAHFLEYGHMPVSCHRFGYSCRYVIVDNLSQGPCCKSIKT